MGDSSQTQDQSSRGTSSATQSGATSSTRSPWEIATPGLTSALNDATGLYGSTSNPFLAAALNNGQNTAIGNATGGATTSLANQGMSGLASLFGNGGLSTPQSSALSGIGSSLAGFNQGNATNSAYLTNIANGSQIGANNGQFAAGLKQSLGDAADTINSGAAGWGGSGSVAQTKALVDRLGTIASNAYATQYNTDKANQLSAIGQLSSINSAGLSGNLSGQTAASGIGQQGVANQLSGIGSISGLNTAQNLDANNLMSVGNQGWSNLNNYASLLASIGGMGGTSSGSTSGTSSGTNTSNGTTTTSIEQSPLGMMLAGLGGVSNMFSSGGGGKSAASGIGSALSSLALLGSDRRLKDDIEPVGTLFDGQTVYRYRYKGMPKFHIGLIAQEVAERLPEAVGVMPGLDGMLGVDYRKATEHAIAQREAA